MLDSGKYPSAITADWSVHAFAIDKMMMWESIRNECTQNEYMTKLVVANFVGRLNHRLIFFKSVIDNVFLYQEVKDMFVMWFFKMQRAYWGFLRLARKWKWRKPRIQIHSDLYMNEISLSHKHTYPLMQMGNIYLFTLSNLANLVKTSICNANHFCNEPLPIKNPYNNVAISKADLYNIYFRVRETYFKVPFFFRRFFECDFNIYRFKMECEKELREHSIQEYVKTADYRDVFADIDAMIRKYDVNRYIKISSGVDMKVVIDAFRPYLATYYLSLYSFDRMQQSYCEMQLSRDILRFVYTNCMFGQKTGRRARSGENPFVSTPKSEYHVNFVRPSHVRLSTEHFMKSHVFNDTVFDRYISQGDVNGAYILPIVAPLRSSEFFSTVDSSVDSSINAHQQEGADMDVGESEMQEDSDEENTDVVITAEERLSEVSDYNSEDQEEDDPDW